MTENLNFGTAILEGQDQTNNGTMEKYCYDNLVANCNVYGGLYQWAEMVQYLNGATNTTSWNPVPAGPVQGICPAGWHLPTDAEWVTLTSYLGGTGVAGGSMKETGTAHWLTPNTGATNSSGFTAMPGGRAGVGLSSNAYLWSASEFIVVDAWARSLSYANAGVNLFDGNKLFGLSVRCLQN